MKIRVVAIVVGSLLLLTTACQRSDINDGIGQTVSIAYLKSLTKGEASPITDDVAITGIVVGNDWLGEFYKSIYIVDDSGGIEIAIDSRELASLYPIYSQVKIYCCDLWLCRAGSNIAIGAEPTGNFPVEPIPIDIALLRVWCGLTPCDVEPLRRQPNEISHSDIGRLVYLSAIRATEQGNGCWCDCDTDGPVDTWRKVENDEGETFYIRTAGETLYALEPMPKGYFDAVGIVGYAEKRYYLRLTNKEIREHK